MGSFDTDINIQTSLGVFLLIFCLVLAILGALLIRFRFLDGKSFRFSQGLGKLLIVLSAILALAAALLLIYVRVTF